MPAPKAGVVHDENRAVNDRWSDNETKLHINILERLTTKFAMYSLLPVQGGKKYFRNMTGNSIAISYVNRQGGVRFMACKKRYLGILYKKRVCFSGA